VDFSLSAEQYELTEAAADFARRELNQDLAKREDTGQFPQEAWRACARFGIQGLPVPAEGAGIAIFNSSMEWERSCLFASAVGAMRRQLEACVGYARSREQFGQPIGKFQGVADKMADMYVRLEARGC
jgi:alkylation response protein AidB-like acyl-CoA dehydrogenase